MGGKADKWVSEYFVVGESAATDYANMLLSRAVVVEKRVTPLLQEISTRNNAELVGLDFRLKSVESLERKIQTDSIENGVSISEASTNISDALRYTMVIPEKNFGTNVLSTLDALELTGMTRLRVNNTFQPEASYMGVNTNFATVEGQIFELQFHTADSFAVKQNINHSLYEEFRLPSTTLDREIELVNQMKLNSSAITLPEGANSIKNFNSGR